MSLVNILVDVQTDLFKTQFLKHIVPAYIRIIEVLGFRFKVEQPLFTNVIDIFILLIIIYFEHLDSSLLKYIITSIFYIILDNQIVKVISQSKEQLHLILSD